MRRRSREYAGRVNDPLIIEKAACALRTVVAVFPVVSLYYMGIFYFQARGNSGISLIGSLLRQMIILLPTAYFLSRVMGLGGQGVWLVYPVTDILSTLLRSEERRVGKECRSRWSPYH